MPEKESEKEEMEVVDDIEYVVDEDEKELGIEHDEYDSNEVKENDKP